MFVSIVVLSYLLCLLLYCFPHLLCFRFEVFDIMPKSTLCLVYSMSLCSNMCSVDVFNKTTASPQRKLHPEPKPKYPREPTEKHQEMRCPCLFHPSFLSCAFEASSAAWVEPGEMDAPAEHPLLRRECLGWWFSRLFYFCSMVFNGFCRLFIRCLLYWRAYLGNFHSPGIWKTYQLIV